MALSFFILRSVKCPGNHSNHVLHYQATIEPNITDKSIKGEVSIRFQLLGKAAQTIVLKLGSLQIDQVMINRQAVMYRVEKKRLLITLKPEHITQAEIKVDIQYRSPLRNGCIKNSGPLKESTAIK